jgi:hypothetical protein
VLGFVLIWGSGTLTPDGDAWSKIVLGILSFNFPIELTFCLVVVPTVTYALYKARHIPVKTRRKGAAVCAVQTEDTEKITQKEGEDEDALDR